MDRFKVRMYDKNTNKMYHFDNDCSLEATFECLKQQLAFESGLDVLKPISYNHIEDGRVFMQCSGLKDVNGKLIYEGDILNAVHFNCFGEKITRIGFVEIKDLQLCVREPNVSYSLFDGLMEYEVIGNIHQNKRKLLCMQ